MTMTKGELEILHSYIDSAKNYLEFGSGESTIYASKAPMITNIDSVESSEAYINENLRPNPAVAKTLSTGKLLFHIIDIGETKNWGHPKNKSKKHLWPNYSLNIFSKKNNYDLVLVDGRFRVSCILNSILNTPENCIIMVHDFWDRPQYRFLLKYLEVKDKIDTLGVFSKKKDVDLKKLQSIIKKYQYLPRDKTFFDKVKQLLRETFWPSPERPELIKTGRDKLAGKTKKNNPYPIT